ncbi:MAG: hypothetical protein JXQ80_04540 [Bacteroidales bacterium]|nr:hypothetical protein [Bacteroidales bacterium]
MDANRENIDRYFSKKLSGFQQDPPEEVWDNIALKLHERKKKKALLLFFRIAAGMAIVTAIGIAYYLGNNSNDSKHLKGVAQHQPVNTTGRTDSAVGSPSDRHTPANETVQPAPDGIQPVPEKVTPLTPVPAEKQVILSNADAYHNARENALKTDYPVVVTNHATGDNVLLATAVENNGLTPLPVKLVFVPSARVPHTFDRMANMRTITPEEAEALLLAQYNIPAEAEKSADIGRTWSFGTEMAPLYSYRSIQSDKSYAAVVDEFNEYESGVMAYAGGVKIAVTSGKRLTIQSGMYYSRYGQHKTSAETQYNTYAASIFDGNNESEKSISVINSTGVIKGEITDQTGRKVSLNNQLELNTVAGDADSRYYSYLNAPSAIKVESEVESNTTLDQYFEYVELPLLLKYKIIDRRFDFCFSGGLVTNILVGTKIYLDNDAIDAVTDDITTVNYLGSFGLGFEYPVYKRFAFTLEPRFRYYFNPIDKNAGYNVHPYSFGIFAGFNYLF